MLVLGLLTIVAAAGVVTMERGNGQRENPYVNVEGQEGFLAGESNAQRFDAQVADKAGTNEQTEHFYENPDTVVQEETHTVMQQEEKEEVQEAGAGLEAATAFMLDFSDSAKMTWPIRGNVVLDYNMASTIYFPTLDQYKCNPGVVIQGEVSDPVYAPANARVLEVGMNEEIGNYLKLDLGNEYVAICGQLKEITAVQGEYLEKGQLLGYVAEPTKYYTVEGSNVFFRLNKGEKAVDPLDYLE